MSVRMLEDRELSAPVTFAARHDLLALSAGRTADRLHQVNWDAYAEGYEVEEARRSIAFDWAPTDAGRVFSLAGDYLYNVLEPPADVADLLRRIRKAAAAQLSATGGSDPQI